MAACGREALATKGAGGVNEAHPAQLAELKAALDAGPAMWGSDQDQCWTWPGSRSWRPAGSGGVHAGRMNVLLTDRVERAGPGPAGRRAAGGGIAAWRQETWPIIKDGRGQGAWLVFEDESGQGLRPQRAAPGAAEAGPVVTVTGGSNKRVSLAALIAVKPGQRPARPVHDGARAR